jgi:CRP/FNR family transcriptional regulator
VTLSRVQTAAWLEAFPELCNVDDATLRQVTRVAEITEVARTTTIFREGGSAHKYFFIVEGRVRIYKTIQTGREIMLYRTVRGETCMVTTATLLSGGRYPASAIAEVETLLVQLSATDFRAIFDRSRIFRDIVCSTLRKPVQDIILLIERIALRNVDARLADWILQNDGIDSYVEISQRELAFQLGTAREVVSRRLKAFELNGWILRSRKRIQVVDRESLSTMALASIPRAKKYDITR